MASQGPLSPSTVVSDSVAGNVTWGNPGNAASSNNSYADTSGGGATGGDIAFSNVTLRMGGVEVGADRGDFSSLSGSDTYKTFGASTDKWGLTPTVAQVNGSDFGVMFYLSDGGDTWSTTEWLAATNFGFSVPAGATIDGIVVEVENRQAAGVAYIDHVRATVYYTAAAGGQPAVKRMGGVTFARAGFRSGGMW